MNYYNNTLQIMLLGALLLSCTEFIEVDPPKTEIGSSTVFNNDATAIAAIRGIYSSIMGGENNFACGSGSSVSVLGGISSDEMVYNGNSVDQHQFFQNSLAADNLIVYGALWGETYKYINNINSLLEGLEESSEVTDSVKNQLIGEGKFLRAFCYFYLVNLFGDIPLVTTTDYRINAVAPRTESTQVYQQIIDDLKEAKEKLANDYVWSGGERTQPNSWAATAMLSRVYLYLQEWALAEQEATRLINENSLFNLQTQLENVFLANSNEAIWQLQPVNPNFNTYEGRNFIMTTGLSFAYLTTDLVNTFDDEDQRLVSWIGSYDDGDQIYYFPHKYKMQAAGSPKEYSMVLRLAEQYLIRAEARARMGTFAGALDDLNILRGRAGLPDIQLASQTEILLAIERERRLELFSEWGHRWLDLKRTGRADILLGPLKPDWQTSDVLYPIPIMEIEGNPGLTQNPGYSE